MCQWCRGLSEDALTYLSEHSRLARHEADELILSRSEKMHSVAVIRRGGLRNIISSEDGSEHAGLILRPGSFYGAVGVLNDILSPHDIVADGRTEMVCVSYRTFRHAMSCYPDITLLLANVLTHRLRRSYTLFNQLALDSLETRVRRTILMMSSPETGASILNSSQEIKIKQEELGLYVQSSRPTINKALKNLERLGIIEVGYGVIRILDREALSEGIEPGNMFYF